LIANLVMLAVAIPLQNIAWNTFDDPDVANVIGIVCMLMASSSVAVVAILCGWGPGPMWYRGMLVCATVTVYAVTLVGVELVLNNLYFDSVYYPTETPMQLASHISNGLSLVVPMAMALVFFAAVGRWRIGPPSLGPVKLTIAHVMIGTALLAVLFVVNAEIQHRYYQILFADFEGDTMGGGDFTSVSGQRFQTMMIASVTAPIAAVTITMAAWSAYALYARLGILFVLLMLSSITWVANPEDAANTAGLFVGAAACSAWIALNIRLIGRAGWPLSRRTHAIQISDAAA